MLGRVTFMVRSECDVEVGIGRSIDREGSTIPAKSARSFEEFREELLSDPVAKEQYDRTRRTLTAFHYILKTIDLERERAGLSKAELARRVGVNPASIRRLFTSNGSNPTLDTILDLIDVLGLEVSLQRRIADERCVIQSDRGN